MTTSYPAIGRLPTAECGHLGPARTGREPPIELGEQARLAASRERFALYSISVKAKMGMTRPAYDTACRRVGKVRRQQFRRRIDAASNQVA